MELSEPGNEFDFYLHDELNVTGVWVDGRRVRYVQAIEPYDYEYTARANHIRVGSRTFRTGAIVRVDYAGRFSPSAERSPSDYMRVDGAGIFLRAYGYSMWFPTFLATGSETYTADFERIAVNAPRRFQVVAVGEQISRRESWGRATTVWSAEDVSLFDAQLTARAYEIAHEGPILAYSLADADSLAARRRVLIGAGELVRYYRTHYREDASGASVVHVLQLPEFGDIASGNVVGVADDAWRSISVDSPEFETLAHELVHAFIQGRTPREDRLFAFSIEGFPSYFHWPALAAIRGEAAYQARMDRVQQRYLERRTSGVDGRGDPLPPEKPLLEIDADEIGVYKDRFILNDRALLYWDWMRRSLGANRFDEFVRIVANRSSLTADEFFALIEDFAPQLADDSHLWLETNTFPERFRRET